MPADSPPRLPRPIAVLVAGDPIAPVRGRLGGYADLIRRAAGAPPLPWLDVDLRGPAPLPDPRDLAAVIVTGSPSSVTERAGWMTRGEAYLRELVSHAVPTFGICFGHQLLGQALGGEVARNPRGREIGTVALEKLDDDPLLDTSSPPDHANATHVDTVIRLPEGARVLARTALEPHAVVRFGRTTWGVQFHPEMDAGIIRQYIDARRDLLAGEGLDPDALLAAASDAPAGRSTLTRFLALAQRRWPPP